MRLTSIRQIHLCLFIEKFIVKQSVSSLVHRHWRLNEPSEVSRNYPCWHYWHFILLKYENDLELVTTDISFNSLGH